MPKCRFLRAVVAAVVGLSACGLAPGAEAPAAGKDRRAPGLIVAPDDGTEAIVNAIKSARRSVLVEMYMLTSPAALAALLTAEAAGCQVRVLLEPAPYGAATANQPAFQALAAAGVDVRWFSVPGGLVHAKLILIDDTTAYILTLNLTGAGLGGNREYAIVDLDPGDVTRVGAIWNADAVGANPGPALAGTRIVVSPIDARSRLGAAIDGARTSIAIEMEELSDQDLVSHLLAARDRAVDITVVAPAGNQSPNTAAALSRLAAGGVTVRGLDAPPVHAKAMIIDSRWVYVGSVNFTRASLDDNREIGILFNDPAKAARIAATITTDAAHGLSP